MIIDLIVRLKRASIPGLAVALATLLLLAAVHAAEGNPAKPDNSPFSAIYILGDSLSDTGRSSAVLTLPPEYAPGRMCNGPLWIEYFAPKIQQAYNPFSNFAWVGALTGVDNIFPPLPGMLNEMAELRDLVNRRLDPKALYIVFGGSNDFQRITLPSALDASCVIQDGITHLHAIVASLQQFGAKNIVVVDIPDLGQTPRVRRLGANIAQTATLFSVAFNSGLDAALSTLSGPVCRVSLFNLTREFADKPNKYGFTNVTDAAFPDHVAQSDTYLFWDEAHPTTRAHRHLADEIFLTLAKAGMLNHGSK